ncbi:electron transfer flavoprotein beta subunit [Desulfitobacterium sp. LBE]|uniref:Electron transfer flavoprotein small subunit n=2 Tax=root TaxID=1 RepID=B8G0V9_DESHD|nr:MULTISPECIES: electron transfer flavoprotein [Desulfitobacterium]ACL18378.1 Electron transfer flavoprotein alpha/beta-subunit [Desulfitobacterium hafniense DCB-2]MEA5023666.1 electron transfer flavoprotein [Desulfitobacterium hafniense]TWH58694.1 electron transfer flavoprotein beta subunit [Desulfitobacterium sp. LBE]
MNIIACFKVVPEEQDITIKPNREISFEKAPLAISAYDLNCIEAGIQLAEAHGASLIGVSVGAAKIDDSKLKKNVLSRGPESIFMIADDQLDNLDTYQTANALKGLIAKIGDYGLILCGEGSADLYAQQVGPQLGQLLNLPTINSVSKLTLEGDKAIVERTLENEVENLEIALPAVVSVTSDINLPRIPSMKQILAAGKKQATIWKAGDAGVGAVKGTIEVIETKAPEQTDRKQDIVQGDSDESIKEFVAKIREILK